jgi:hypothetical protein
MINICSMRVYRYWRGQGFSPEDARLMVDSFIAHRRARQLHLVG